jgi:hypothetical protein
MDAGAATGTGSPALPLLQESVENGVPLMPTNISIEKVKELIRLADRARAEPTADAHDPRRLGPAGSEGLEVPTTPSVPQPADDWAQALERYVSDLPEEALDEIISLYRTGGGGGGEGQDMGAGPSSADAPDFDRTAYILTRRDLPECLRTAVDRL